MSLLNASVGNMGEGGEPGAGNQVGAFQVGLRVSGGSYSWVIPEGGSARSQGQDQKLYSQVQW